MTSIEARVHPFKDGYEGSEPRSVRLIGEVSAERTEILILLNLGANSSGQRKAAKPIVIGELGLGEGVTWSMDGQSAAVPAPGFDHFR